MAPRNTKPTLFIDIFVSEELYRELEPEWSPEDRWLFTPSTGDFLRDEYDVYLDNTNHRKLLDEYEGFLHVYFESDLINEISESMGGKRHLVHLHRLHPLPAYARDTDNLFYDHGLVGHNRLTEAEVLACLQHELTQALGAPRGPVFCGSYNQARDIVHDVRDHLVRWRSGVRQEAEILARQEEANARRTPADERGSSYDRQSDPDSVGSKAWWAALKEDIARCRKNRERHSLRVCNVLDGLHGRTWQKWLERELGTTASGRDSGFKPKAQTRVIRCITCGYNFAPDVGSMHSWARCPECGFNTPRC